MALRLAESLAELIEQVQAGRADQVNQYPEAVTPRGNRTAQDLLAQVFEPAEVRWRGLGVIPDSGLVLRSAYRTFDARRRFGLDMPVDREPKGCLCGQVISGRVTPPQCELFGSVCTPIQPIGPCMVSSEGTCQAWFKYGRHPSGPGARRASDPAAASRKPVEVLS